MRNLFFVWVLFLNVQTSVGQSPGKDEKSLIVSEVKELLNTHFVNVEKARLVNDSLDVSTFAQTDSVPEFLEVLNRALFYYTGDKHLSVEYNPGYAQELEENRDDKAAQAEKEKKEAYGFHTAEILPGNIGYLALKYFSDTSHSKETAYFYLDKLKDTKSLIIDLRGNSGGSGSMVQLLCSYFLPAPAQPLLEISYRNGNTVTLKTYAEKRRPVYTKPLFILCDKNTFSAAEAFALIMKNRKRALVIGDTTSGAGNISGPYLLGKAYIITIPVGKIVDPLTGQGWEGTGVAPDIQADSAQSLKMAEDLARKVK